MTTGTSPTGTAEGRWLLRNGEHRIEAEAAPRGKTRWARLLVDGRRVAEKETKLKSLTVKLDEIDEPGVLAEFGEGCQLKVVWDWLGDASHVAVLVPKPKDGEEGEEGGGGKVSLVKADKAEDEDDDKEEKLSELLKRFDELPFAPPEGTRAHKREKFAREHPKVYAARHVALATSKVIWPLLGIGLAIKLPWPDIPWPDLHIPMPDVDLPSIPWPDIDLPDIPWPDWHVPGWIKAILRTTKYWIPILIAMGMAVGEYDRRKKQRAKVAELAAKKDDDRRPARHQPHEREE
ncbi:hypothetical protein [Actinomadura hibisca]|uniref:hypothetical protein n=1 Tax=Actinomadura hibisca TaxID=68565 RepID=UPI00082ABEC6|nr:hypothetical protein [Actinomadura hibisca]